jgi:hypothetical protein
MFQQLQALDQTTALHVARSVLSDGTSQLKAVSGVLAQLEDVPRSWLREWALTVLRRNGDAALAKRFRASLYRGSLTTTVQLALQLGEITLGITHPVKLTLTLVSPTTLDTVTVSKERIMSIAENSQLPFQVHLGALEIGVDELLSLRRGERLTVNLPERIVGTIHTLGAPVGEAVLTIKDGAMTLEVTQLFSQNFDKAVRASF